MADPQRVMWLDAAALLVLGIFIGMGALRGAFATGMSLVALAAGYGAAVLAAPRLGPVLAEPLGASRLVGVALAGTAAFALAYAAVSIGAVVRRRLRRPLGGPALSRRDRFSGGVFGAVRGSALVLALAWLALWVDVLRVSGAAPGLPPLDDSAAAAVAARAVEAGVAAALSEQGSSGRVVARLAARPGDTLVRLQDVVEHGRVAALREDRVFWTHVQHGSVDNAMNRLSFVQVARDGELRQRLSELGMIDPGAVDDPAAFREAFAPVLQELGERLRGLRDDPELQALASDGDVIAMVQGGDTFGLLAHPGFRRVVARVASGAAPE